MLGDCIECQTVSTMATVVFYVMLHLNQLEMKLHTARNHRLIPEPFLHGQEFMEINEEIHGRGYCASNRVWLDSCSDGLLGGKFTAS